MSKNVTVVAGPNGSGKTTFAREYLRDSEISEYISADAIAERLVSRPEDMDSVKIQAGRLFIKEIHALIEVGTDFIVEVTLRAIVDSWHLFYNSAEYPEEVASGERNSVTVINETFFELFMRDIRSGGT